LKSKQKNRSGVTKGRRLAIVCGHMFLLCGHLFLLYGSKTTAEPYVSIVSVKTICWAICFRRRLLWVIPSVAQNHLLFSASLSAICFYCVDQKHLLGHMFLLWASKPSATHYNGTVCWSRDQIL